MKIRATLPDPGRDLRLDLFRGLANWLIFFGHIPHSLLAWLTMRNYGFSDGADLFVFISGYTATLVYARMMMERGFIVGATRLWKRVWQIYVAQLLLFLFYTASIHHVAHGFDLPGLMDQFNVAGLIDHPVEILTQAITLKFKPVNLDVLPLYIVLMAAFPFVLWLMLRQPDAIMLASLVLYLAARHYRLDLAAYPTGVWYFDPFTWQFLFMLGAWLALGGSIGLKAAAQARWSLVLSVAFLVFAFAMTLSEPFPALRVLFPEELRTLFTPNDKTYLAPYRVAHLAALMVLVVRFMPRDWHGLEWKGFAPLIKCGQHSLEVFCVGVYLSFVAHFIFITVSDSLPMQLAVGAGGLAIMVAVAWYRGWSKDVDRPIPRFASASAAAKAAIPPPPWQILSERSRRRQEAAERLKLQRGGTGARTRK
ncbi:MAG: OpgC domain-containing protein [Bradyrhizobium sp.]